jgi:hypothetical protein
VGGPLAKDVWGRCPTLPQVLRQDAGDGHRHRARYGQEDPRPPRPASLPVAPNPGTRPAPGSTASTSTSRRAGGDRRGGGGRGGGGRRVHPGAWAEVRPARGFGGAGGQGSRRPWGRRAARGTPLRAGDRRAVPNTTAANSRRGAEAPQRRCPAGWLCGSKGSAEASRRGGVRSRSGWWRTSWRSAVQAAMASGRAGSDLRAKGGKRRVRSVTTKA